MAEKPKEASVDELRAQQKTAETLRKLLDIAVDARKELSQEWADDFREYLGPRNKVGFWTRIRRQGKRARTKTNYLFSLIETIKPILSNEMPSISLRPVIDTETWRIIAEEAFVKPINRIFERCDLRRQNLELITNGLFFGLGLYKAIWDNEAMNGAGDIKIQIPDTRTIYLEPGKISSGEENWFFEVTEVDEMTLIRKFPDRADDIRAMFRATGEGSPFPSPRSAPRERLTGLQVTAPGAAASTDSARFFDIAQDMMKHNNSKNYPTMQLIEVWFRDDSMVETLMDMTSIDMKTGKEKVKKKQKAMVPEFPNGRYIQFAGNIVFKDEKNEFPGFPYVQYRNYFVPGQQYSLSELRNMVPIQRQYDIRNNQLYDFMNYNMNPTRFYDARSGLDPKTVTNAPAAWIRVNDVAGIRTDDAPRVSQAAFESLVKIKQEIETVVGVREVTQGTIPGDIRSGNAIEALQEAADVRLRGKSREMESALKELTRYLIKMVNQFYIPDVHFRVDRFVDVEGKKIPITETDEWKLVEKGEITPDFFEVVVRAGVNLPRSRVARQDAVKDLHTRGVVDDKYLVDQLQLDGVEDLKERMAPTWDARREAGLVEAETAAQGAPQQGAPNG